MAKKFLLKSHIFLVKGAKRGAIYDLNKGNVYSIDEHAATLIEKCERGLSLEKILEDYSSEIRPAVINCFEELAKLAIGQFCENCEATEKISVNPPNLLDFMWLEVTTSCNLKCLHCYSDSRLTYLEKGKMGEEDWVRVMKEGRDIGCRKIQFIGGEPFLLDSQLYRLILVARSLDYGLIEVFTNATLINETEIEFLANNKIAVAVSVYGENQEIHEQVTRTSGSFDRTINTLRKMVARNIRVRVGIIGMAVNENHIEETIRFLKEEVGIKTINVDFVRPAGRGCDALLSPNLLEKSKLSCPCFSKCTLEMFKRMRYGHNCFSKDICITATGNIFPCIMERDIILGNILEMPLSRILESENAKQIRNLNKDRIETCKDCEYRYCCFDCRPKAKGRSSNSNFYIKPAECLYNPYSGEWAKN